MGLIYFKGQSSADYGFEISKPPEHNFPKRIYEKVIVPGKDGEVVYDTGSFSNVPREYDINFIVPDGGTYEESARKVVEFLHSPGGGYFRLEDTYEPDYYREACFEDDGSISNIFDQGGSTIIKFNCKPNLWFKSGEIEVSFTRQEDQHPTSSVTNLSYSLTLTNPSKYLAKPDVIFSNVPASTTAISVSSSWQGWTSYKHIHLGEISEMSSDERELILISSETQNTLGKVVSGKRLNLNGYINRQAVPPDSEFGYPILAPLLSNTLTATITVDNSTFNESQLTSFSIKAKPKWWTL